MSPQLASQAVLLLLANLPAAISTGAQLLDYMVKGIAFVKRELGGKSWTLAEVHAVVQRAVAETEIIDAID